MLFVHDHVVHLQLAEILQSLCVVAEQLALALHELLALYINGLRKLQAPAGNFNVIIIAILERQASGEISQERKAYWNAKRKPNQLIHINRDLLPDFPIGWLTIVWGTIIGFDCLQLCRWRPKYLTRWTNFRVAAFSMPSSFKVALPLERWSSIGWFVSTLSSPKQRHRNRHETNARWSCPLRWAEWTNSPVELATATGCRRSSESSAIPRRRRRSSHRSRWLRLCWAREIKAIALFSWAIVGSCWWSCKEATS